MPPAPRSTASRIHPSYPTTSIPKSSTGPSSAPTIVATDRLITLSIATSLGKTRNSLYRRSFLDNHHRRLFLHRPQPPELSSFLCRLVGTGRCRAYLCVVVRHGRSGDDSSFPRRRRSYVFGVLGRSLGMEIPCEAS